MSRVVYVENDSSFLASNLFEGVSGKALYALGFASHGAGVGVKPPPEVAK